jgi:hypothetical protein
MTIDSLIMMTREGIVRLPNSVGRGARAVFNLEQDSSEFGRGRGSAKSEETACGGLRGRSGFVAFGQEDEGGDVAAGSFVEVDPGRIGGRDGSEEGVEAETPAEEEGFGIGGDWDDAVVAGGEEVDEMAGFGGIGGEEEEREGAAGFAAGRGFRSGDGHQGEVDFAADTAGLSAQPEESAVVACDAVSNGETPFFGRGFDGEFDDEAGALAIAGGGEAEAAVAGGGEEFLGAEDDAEEGLFKLPVGSEDQEGRVGQVEARLNLAQAPGFFAKVGQFPEQFDQFDGAGESFAGTAKSDQAIKGLVCGCCRILKSPVGFVSGIGVVEAGGDTHDFRHGPLELGGDAREQLADGAEAFAAQNLLAKQALVEEAKSNGGLIGEVGKRGRFVEHDVPTSGPTEFQNTGDRSFASHRQEQLKFGPGVMADRSGSGKALLHGVAARGHGQ